MNTVVDCEDEEKEKNGEDSAKCVAKESERRVSCVHTWGGENTEENLCIGKKIGKEGVSMGEKQRRDGNSVVVWLRKDKKKESTVFLEKENGGIGSVGTFGEGKI